MQAQRADRMQRHARVYRPSGARSLFVNDPGAACSLRFALAPGYLLAAPAALKNPHNTILTTQPSLHNPHNTHVDFSFEQDYSPTALSRRLKPRASASSHNSSTAFTTIIDQRRTYLGRPW